jgi:hypothetical protein
MMFPLEIFAGDVASNLSTGTGLTVEAQVRYVSVRLRINSRINNAANEIIAHA